MLIRHLPKWYLKESGIPSVRYRVVHIDVMQTIPTLFLQKKEKRQKKLSRKVHCTHTCFVQVAYGGNLGRGWSFTSRSTKNITEGVPKEAGVQNKGELENLSPLGRHQSLQEGYRLLGRLHVGGIKPNLSRSQGIRTPQVSFWLYRGNKIYFAGWGLRLRIKV